MNLISGQSYSKYCKAIHHNYRDPVLTDTHYYNPPIYTRDNYNVWRKKTIPKYFEFSLLTTHLADTHTHWLIIH